MKRSDLVVWLPWFVLAVCGLWFAGHGFVRHDPIQRLLEVGGLGIVGLAQARFAPEGTLRSPLIPGVLAVSWTAMVLGPRGLSGLVFWVGVVVLAVALVGRLERARRWGLVAGIIASILASVTVRLQVLSRTGGGEGDRVSSVGRSTLNRVVSELAPPTWPTPAPSATGGPIVLITVDTLRADLTVRMPAFQRLTERGAWWRRAMSTSSWTVPAVGTLTTGLVPSSHGAGVHEGGGLQGLDPAVPTLAEQLSDAGWSTAAFATNAWLAGGLGFDRGFQLYRHADRDFPHRLVFAGFPNGPKAHEAGAVVSEALTWLEDAPEDGWFLWVHLLDPHLPYVHAEGSLEAGLSDERLRAGMRHTPEIRARVRAAYEHEVGVTDAHLGRLLDALEARGVLERGLVVMTADHGEELWDHGGTGHGHQHHTEVVDVGLVVAGAGVTPGERTDLASLLDIVPTLSAAAGLAPLGEGLDLREALPDRILTAQGNAYFVQQRSARDASARAILESPEAPRARCYLLASDPTEQIPGDCSGHPALEAAVFAVQAPAARGGEEADVDRAALEALGYVEGD